MTLNESREVTKRSFIKKKLDALYAMLDNSHSANPVALNLQNPHFKQFTIFYDKEKSEYHITNPSGNGCSFTLGTTCMTIISMFIDIKLYDIKHQYLLKTETDMPLFLYCLLEQFENIEQDYLQLMEGFDKLEESANIIRKWIEAHFRDSNYDYHLTETENKILLSVPLRGSVQLSIPIYYKRYQQILPQIMATIKAYENVVVSSKIKVLITPKQYNYEL